MAESVDQMCGSCAWRKNGGSCFLPLVTKEVQENRARMGNCEDACVYTLESGNLNVGVGMWAAAMFKLATGSWAISILTKR